MIYTPQNPPQDPKDLPAFLSRELQRIAEAMAAATDTVQFAPQERVPKRPRDGMVAFTTGANWNPGAGGGHYGYRAGTWRLLG